MLELSAPRKPLEMTSGALRMETQLAPPVPDIFLELQAGCESLAALIARVADGEQEALTALYDLTRRQIYGLLTRLLKNAATAEEVLLDVYTQVWQQANRFDRKRGSPFAWLMIIARSRALDRLRSGRLEAAHTEEMSEGTEVADTRDVETTAAANEIQRLVLSALNELPQEQREVIELAYFGGLTQSELVERLGLPLGTVKTRVRRGLLKLREILQPVSEGMR